MMSKFCFRAFASVVVTIAVSLSPVHAEEASPESTAGMFENRIVYLVIDRSSALESKHGTEFLQDAEVQKIGGRYFIVGTAYRISEQVADGRGSWREGSRIGIAWEKVRSFYILSPDKMDELMKKWKEENE